MIVKFVRLKVAGFGFDDVRGQVQHVLWNFFICNVLEIFILFADLIRIAQRNPEKTFTPGFERVTCSREVNTTRPSATMPSLRIASRMTANACWPTSPSGTR